MLLLAARPKKGQQRGAVRTARDHLAFFMPVSFWHALAVVYGPEARKQRPFFVPRVSEDRMFLVCVLNLVGIGLLASSLSAPQ